MTTHAAPLLKPSSTRCYGHPRLAARFQCAACDRGLCEVCAFDCQDGDHLCPRCLEAAEDRIEIGRQNLKMAYTLAGISGLCMLSGQVREAELLTQVISFGLRYLAPLVALVGLVRAVESSQVIESATDAVILNGLLVGVTTLVWLAPLLRALLG